MVNNNQEGLDSKLRDISVMYELVSSIGTTLDMNVELETFLQKLLKRFGYSVGSVLIRDKENDTFVVKLTSGYLSGKKPETLHYKMNQYGIADLVARRAPLVRNTLTEADKKIIISPELSRRVKSFLFIPIMFEEDVLGIVRLFSFSENAFPEKAVRMMLPLVNRLGKAINHIATIERLKQAEKSLRHEQEFTEAALNAQTDTFFVFDPSNGRPVRWNRTFSTVTGYSDEEIANMKAPDDWCKEEEMPRVQNAQKQVLIEGYASLEISLITKDGRTIPTEFHASVVQDKDGTSEYIIALGRDITERKQAELEKKNLEAQLRQAHKMEAIGTLAGGIAHDFNNILAIILGYSEMVRNDLPGNSPVIKEIDEVLLATHRAKDLVKQILAFSRKSEEDRSSLDIKSLVNEVLRLLRATIPSTIEIKKNISAKCGNIMADATQMHQVIMNICTNAAQAMEEKGGVLQVDLDEVELSRADLIDEPERKPGKYVRLNIRDTGDGIDSAIIDRIFDPYFTTKGFGKGSGMGLAVVLGIIRSHEGLIRVDSRPGQGTAFEVFFPRLASADNPQNGDAGRLLPGSEHILFVDDEECLVGFGEKFLKRLGYRVTGKTSSIEALEMLRANPDDFDLVVTDQTMPNMAGDDLAREIMKIRPDMPVILCTGFSSKIDQVKAAEIGIKEFIMKPVDIVKLGNVIRQVLDGTEGSPRKNE